jgi:hypothetical protein
VLFWEYETLLNFERNVREHLIRHILSLTSLEPIIEPQSSTPSDGPSPTKREPTSDVIEQIKRPKVFIGYSHEDRDEVSKIYKDLRAAGFDPWLDVENLMPGQMWHKEIDIAIKEADSILLCFIHKVFVKERLFPKRAKNGNRYGS